MQVEFPSVIVALVLILTLNGKLSECKVSCVVCDNLQLNISSPDFPKTDCPLKESEACTLTLRADYVNENKSFVLIYGLEEELLLLTNGEPQTSYSTSIWFNKVGVQRLVSINCFSGTGCGVDMLRDIYKNQIYPFDYAKLQKNLAEKLYTQDVSSLLTCSDSNDNPVNCPDGFCRSIFDATGQISLSNCVKKGSVEVAYGMTVSSSSMKDIVDVDQSAIMYTCNTPLCNSRETIKSIRQQLIDAKLISQEIPASTQAPTRQSTSTKSAASITKLGSVLLYLSSFIVLVMFF